MNHWLDHAADQCSGMSNAAIADYLERASEAAGAEDMGRPDGVLAEAARRIRAIKEERA